jgi:hypothetical protein
MKETGNKKAKIIQSILFLSLSIGSITVIIGLWNFLYAADEAVGGNRSHILYPVCLIPLGLLYGAVAPWITFEGFKAEITGGQLMRLDEDGCYLGPICDFDEEDVKTLSRIFDRESDWRYERFSYSSTAIYMKTAKDGQWFFPDKNDRCLIMTGEPAGNQMKGFRISEEDSLVMDELIQKVYNAN